MKRRKTGFTHRSKTKVRIAPKRTPARRGPRATSVLAIDERGIIATRRKGAPFSVDSLTLLAFSDVEEQDLRPVLAWLRASKRKPDFILYAGDGVDRFRPEGGPNYFELFAKEARFGLGAIAGNDEESEKARAYITGERVYELHTCPVGIGKFAILGLDGAPANRGYLNPHEHLEADAREHLISHIRPRLGNDDNVRILCSHAPPWGMLDDSRHQGHLGWQWLAEEILRSHRSDPRLSLIVCGHVHNRGGEVDSHNGVLVVNAASGSRRSDPIPMVWIAVAENVVTAPVAEDWRWIRPTVPVGIREELPASAWECYDLHKVPGVQDSRASVLIDAGIISVYDLANTQLSKLQPLRARLSMGASELTALPIRARACAESRPIALRQFRRPEVGAIYIDIETDLKQSWIWLIGCLDETTGEFRQFVARGPSAERRMLKKFREYAAARPNPRWISYSNCLFEDRVISARLSFHGLAPLGGPGTIADIYSEIHGAMAFPTVPESQGLKGAATVLGFHYRQPALNGFDVGLLAPTGETESISKALLEYNEDDVRSLKYVVDELARRCREHGGSE